MNSKPNISLLYDFYGELLQASQQRVIELYVNEKVTYTADLSEFVKDLEEFGAKKSESTQYESFNLNECGPIELDEQYDLKITWFNADYNVETGELENLYINGYLLDK